MSRKSGSSLLFAAAGAAVIALLSSAAPAEAHGFGYGYGPNVGVTFYGPPEPYCYRPFRGFVAYPYPHFFHRRAFAGGPFVRPFRRFDRFDRFDRFHRRFRNRY
jgi:hypothetical protein